MGCGEFYPSTTGYDARILGQWLGSFVPAYIVIGFGGTFGLDRGAERPCSDTSVRTAWRVEHGPLTLPLPAACFEMNRTVLPHTSECRYPLPGGTSPGRWVSTTPARPGRS